LARGCVGEVVRPNRTRAPSVYGDVISPGLLVVGFLAVLLALRAVGTPESDLVRGVLVMGVGVWLLWTTLAPGHAAFIVYAPPTPRIFSLLVGVWFVVRGALRLDSY